MDKKVRIDLSSPPPVPVEELPEAPAVPVEQPAVKEEPKPIKEKKEPEKKPAPKPEPKPEKKPKKRGGLVLGIVAGVAAAAALLGVYRFVHFWSEPSCDQKARCSICGLEQGDYAEHTWERDGCETPMVCSVCGAQQEKAAGHEWTGGSCTESRICSQCGEAEPWIQGHSYQDGICTVCGAEEKNGVLSWEKSEGRDAQALWHEEDRALVVSDASLQNFAQMTITIRDYRNEWVNKDRYTVERTDDSVRLNLPRDLEPGRYVIHAGVQETKVLEFWYGTGGSWMPGKADLWLAEFVLYNSNGGLYLAQSEQDAPLQGVQTKEEATRFDSPWQMCGGKYQDADSLVLVQGGTSLKFTVDEYRRITGDGAAETACVFRYENWYLTMNADGEVSMTDTLDNGCYWLLDSSL